MVCLLLAAALSSCGRAPPEERLREAIGQMQVAIEERDAGSIEDALAEDFIGPDGLDRTGARRLAQVVFLRHRDVGVTLGPLRVDMKQDHATVEFAAVLTGGSGDLLPDSGRIYDVRTGWRMEGDEWRLTSAQWSAGNK
ncbi:MAG: nuclear transport factor 2 family protein [Pseudomonadota bacterium]|nr:nuclear transport factor 2 family protein [Pseudomonadota bacterium]